MPKTVSPRANLRRGVLKSLSQLKRRIAFVQAQWTVQAMMFDVDGVRDSNGNVQRRARRVDEYPENSAQAWEDFAAQCDFVANLMAENAQFARGVAEQIRADR